MDFTGIQLLWWILIAVLWIGYLTLEGFDFGVGMLMRILPKNARERRLTMGTIGPHWDGNEVWLITAGGATFAAFPEWYATMFSGMYLALVVILLLLIVRIVAIEWRSKINSEKWVNFWDYVHTGAAWLVSLVWGVAFANFVQGTEIQVGHYEGTTFVPADPANVDAALQAGDQHFLTGGFVSLFTPYTILGGLTFVAVFLTHGALFLAIKTRGDFHVRALNLAKKLSVGSALVAAVWVIWGQLAYSANAWGWIPLILAAIGLFGAVAMARQDKDIPAFWFSFGGIAFTVVWVFSTFFPNAMKSSVNDAYHLTISQASATAPTQTVMTIAAIIFIPIVLGYTIWSYKAFSKRLGVENVPEAAAGLDPVNVREFENAK